MTRSMWTYIMIFGVLAVGGVGFLIGRMTAHSTTATEEKKDAAAGGDEVMATPTVTVARVRRQTLTRQITAVGTTIAPAGEIRVMSVPFESHVTRILVTPGQTVAAGDAVIEVEGSAATTLALQQAQDTAAAADRDLKNAQQRYDQKLATNAELFAAQNAQKAAQTQLKSLQAAGAGGSRQLKTDVPGIVSKVDVQLGQVAPIGSALVEIAAQSRIEVKLMVEPEDAAHLTVGQEVELTSVNQKDAEVIKGKIRLVAQRIDPESRMVDVLVALPADAKLLLEGYVQGRMTRESSEGLVVPRSAVSPADEGGFELFTVKDGKVTARPARIALETPELVEVVSKRLKAGELVVVQGNTELEDGMSVNVIEEEAQPTTQKDKPEERP